MRRVPIGCSTARPAERVKAAEMKLDAVDAAGELHAFGSGAARSPQGSDGLRDLRVELVEAPRERCDELLANGRPRRGQLVGAVGAAHAIRLELDEIGPHEGERPSRRSAVRALAGDPKGS